MKNNIFPWLQTIWSQNNFADKDSKFRREYFKLRKQEIHTSKLFEPKLQIID